MKNEPDFDHAKQRLWILRRLLDCGRFTTDEIRELLANLYDAAVNDADFEAATKLNYCKDHPGPCLIGLPCSSERSRDLLYLEIQNSYRCEVSFLARIELDFFRDIIVRRKLSQDFDDVCVKISSRMTRLRARLGMPKLEFDRRSREFDIRARKAKDYRICKSEVEGQ